MKVSVRNLGVIENAEFELKPFTVLIGPNNMGKTWLAYTLSGIFGDFGWDKFSRAYALNKIQAAYPELDEAAQQVLNGGNAKIDMVQFAQKYGQQYINGVAGLAKQWMPEFLRTDLVSFENLSIEIEVSADIKEKISAQILKSFLEGNISPRAGGQALLNISKESGKPELYIYLTSEGSLAEKLPLRRIREFVIASVFRALHKSFYRDVPTFPTERTALITLYFNDPALEERPVTSEILQQERTKPRLRPLIVPVGHFLSMIKAAFQNVSIQGETRKETGNNKKSGKYVSLARYLEQEIFKGSVYFSTPAPDPQRELHFRPIGEKPIEIPIVSSMVKELSSLVLYLRYLAESGDLIVIDEPEMNLHPEAQVKLTEFLAMLVNAGLNLLITTHSPYIVDHLTNLMKAAESNEPEVIQEKFYLKNKDAFIPKKDVSVYLIDKGKAENVLDEDGVVHWGTFGAVSDRVSEIFFEL
jgi:energy-coupling factor transporter ATP-binding protein EcfA2